jgi:hypothetical protein
LLDGCSSLSRSIDAAAQTLALDGEDLDAFRQGAVAVVREMLELGFVVRMQTNGRSRGHGAPAARAIG